MGATLLFHPVRMPVGIPSSESTIGNCPSNRGEESSHRSATIVEYDSVEGDFEPEGACLHYGGGEMGEVRTDSRVRASAIPLTVELSRPCDKLFRPRFR